MPNLLEEQKTEFYNKLESMFDEFYITYTKISSKEYQGVDDGDNIYLCKVDGTRFCKDGIIATHLKEPDIFIMPLPDKNIFFFSCFEVQDLKNSEHKTALERVNKVNSMSGMSYGRFIVVETKVAYYGNLKMRNMIKNFEASDLIDCFLELFNMSSVFLHEYKNR